MISRARQLRSLTIGCSRTANTNFRYFSGMRCIQLSLFFILRDANSNNSNYIMMSIGMECIVFIYCRHILWRDWRLYQHAVIDSTFNLLLRYLRVSIYTSLFVQKEQQARKQTIKATTNINKADRHLHILALLRPWYHITWHATDGSLPNKVFSIIFTARCDA